MGEGDEDQDGAQGEDEDEDEDEEDEELKPQLVRRKNLLCNQHPPCCGTHSAQRHR
ncbi:hypothetical protein J1N35_022960 [Gossypium stocksii]|uniref:Uncharacterized protein n=1 Tax=Gossypium stocksii TaxID=47602 RepID=A0A9D4A3Z9_9ROSI|nr:hypothetical protein J1N35_022960 [Gossypium stocksii]